MATNILTRIHAGEILISDGAMGTLLFERGLKSGDCPEKMNLENPGVLEEISRMYCQAGADIVHANTFGASPLKLAQYGLEKRVEEIVSVAVNFARNGAAENTAVSLSVGPTGKILKPYGDTDAETIYEAFHQQIEPAIKLGVDAVTIETMIDIEEACQAVAAVRAFSGEIPIIATMTFEKGPRGFHTVMGTSVDVACKRLEDAGADVIGSNCGNGSEVMVEVAQAFREKTDLPLVIQSNAGLPEIKEGVTVYPESPQFMTEQMKRLKDIGVSIIGGCCGTTPEHIKTMSLHCS